MGLLNFLISHQRKKVWITELLIYFQSSKKKGLIGCGLHRGAPSEAADLGKTQTNLNPLLTLGVPYFSHIWGTARFYCTINWNVMVRVFICITTRMKHTKLCTKSFPPLAKWHIKLYTFPNWIKHIFGVALINPKQWFPHLT